MTARHDQYVVPGCDHDQILHPHQCYTSAVAVDEAILGVDSDYLAGMRIADFVTFAKRIEGIPASHIRPAHADGDDGDAFRLFHDRIVDRVRRAGRELIAVGHDLVALDHCCFHASPGGGQHLGSMDLKFTQIGIRAEHEDACVPGGTAHPHHGGGGNERASCR